MTESPTIAELDAAIEKTVALRAFLHEHRMWGRYFEVGTTLAHLQAERARVAGEQPPGAGGAP